MSVATLKKKTLTKYNNMSVGSKDGGFSLNGTRRNQGYVGQTSLGRHLPSTPMRGDTPRGHGGCCGTYKITTIVQSGIGFPTNPINGSCANNNPAVVKSSVLQSKGMTDTKYRWIRRPAPYATVKPDTNMIQNTQKAYIEALSKKNIACLKTENAVASPPNSACGIRPRPFGTTIRIPRCWYPITKSQDLSKLGAINQSDFILALGGLCSQNDVVPKALNHCCVLPGPAKSY
jgi:hypothetical protein